MTRIDSDDVVLYQSAMAVIVIGFFGLLVFYLINKPRIADFMIATEAEMKKVNWPSKHQVVELTWVVICGTFLMAILLFVVDIAFAKLFLFIQVLESAPE